MNVNFGDELTFRVKSIADLENNLSNFYQRKVKVDWVISVHSEKIESMWIKVGRLYTEVSKELQDFILKLHTNKISDAVVNIIVNFIKYVDFLPKYQFDIRPITYQK